jgi:hypothetical protein
MELKTQILKALGLNKDEATNLEFQAKLIDGTIIVSTANELVAGIDIAILGEDGTTMPLPIGSYETEEGVGFSVEEEGVVAEIYETEEEEETEEVETEEEEEVEMEEIVEPSEVNERLPKKIKTTEEVEFNKEALINEIGTVIKELLTEVRNDVSRLSAELEGMKGTTETLEIEKETLSAQLEAVSKESAADPITANKFSNNKTVKTVSTIEYRNMSRQEKYWYNINNNK